MTVGLTSGCTKKSTENVAAGSAGQAAASDDFNRGKVIYMTRCIACHNADPKLPGSLGPEIYGSSMELIRLRVTELKYPEGYTPKRKTKIMLAMPDLKNDIAAIHAFLNN
jgi:mono/diheme cytochrome c family protein